LVPAALTGVMQVIVVELLTVHPVAVTPPTVT
jgi:hypothetical protein